MRTLFMGIIGFDLVAAGLVIGVAYSAFQPYTYSIPASMGFSSEPSRYGVYDVNAWAEFSTTTIFGASFVQAYPILASISANVSLRGFNESSDQLFFTFQNAQAVATIQGHGPVCTVEQPYYEGIPLVHVNTTGYYTYYGFGPFCFLGQGNFLPMMVLVNGTSHKTTFLQEGVGQTFALSVETADQLQNYGLNLVGLVLAGILVFFGVMESFGFLRDIYASAFPHRVQYPQNGRKREK